MQIVKILRNEVSHQLLSTNIFAQWEKERGRERERKRERDDEQQKYNVMLWESESVENDDMKVRQVTFYDIIK